MRPRSLSNTRACCASHSTIASHLHRFHFLFHKCELVLNFPSFHFQLSFQSCLQASLSFFLCSPLPNASVVSSFWFWTFIFIFELIVSLASFTTLFISTLKLSMDPSTLCTEPERPAIAANRDFIGSLSSPSLFRASHDSGRPCLHPAALTVYKRVQNMRSKRVFFLADAAEWKNQTKSQAEAPQRDCRGSCASRSEIPSAMPPVWHQVSHHLDGSTRVAAKATAHVVANLRVQCRSQARRLGVSLIVGHRVHGQWRGCRIMCTASSLHRPPVSMARTTNRHRSDAASSVSLSRRARSNTAPSTSAACACGSPVLHNALARVTSTASYAPPKHGRPWARISTRR